MNEIIIDGTQVFAVIERIHELLAHAHQRCGPARREIEPSEKLLPARFRCGVDFSCG